MVPRKHVKCLYPESISVSNILSNIDLLRQLTFIERYRPVSVLCTKTPCSDRANL